MVPQICPTKEHERLHFLHEHGANRPVSPSHVEEMMDSIKLVGIIRPVVVARISFLSSRPLDYVIDGQHLLTALVQMGIDIPYIHVEKRISTYDELVKIVSKLNTSSKSWQLADYVNIWSATGRRPYVKLKNYQNKYKLPYSTLCMALNSDSMSNATERMKEGRFTIKDEDFATSTIEKIGNIFQVLRGAKSEQRVLVQSFIKFYKERKRNYNHTKFMKALSTHRTRVSASLSNMVECQKMLKEIYQQADGRALSVIGKKGLKKAQ